VSTRVALTRVFRVAALFDFPSPDGNRDFASVEESVREGDLARHLIKSYLPQPSVILRGERARFSPLYDAHAGWWNVVVEECGNDQHL
jgi:hypothetical protein